MAPLLLAQDVNPWVAVLGVLATGGLAALAAAIIALWNAWARNKRAAEKSTTARQGELLDRYEKHAGEERMLNDRLYAEIADCTEDRARWEEWGVAMETWANHQSDLCRKRGEEPIPVPPAPARRQRQSLGDVDFARRTAAQTGENLKALATMIRKDDASKTEHAAGSS